MEKIAVTEKAMKEAQMAANEETKSSVGDKYETGRAMNQNAKDISARHLADLLKMKKTMDLIKKDSIMEVVELGALVETSQQIYFISVGLGALNIENTNVMTISAVSPIGQAMIGHKKGDWIEWRNERIEILNVS